MTEVFAISNGLKLYHVNAATEDGESLAMNVLAASHQDALDRVIEYWTRNEFAQQIGPIPRSSILAANWDCSGICHREQSEVMVWEMHLDKPDPATGCILWDGSNGGLAHIYPDVLASLQRRNAII